jgi:hypothetical protein
MSGRTVYVGYGLLLLALLAGAEYRGWGFSPRREVKNVPRSVRDNPGVYRSSYYYTGSGRYMGGK